MSERNSQSRRRDGPQHSGTRSRRETSTSGLTAAHEQLRWSHAELSEQLVEKTAEAHRRADQLQALALQLTEAEERERRRLAALLHDGLQQHLVAIRLQLGRLRKTVDDDPSQTILAGILEMLSEAIRVSRSLSMELSPPVLYHEGLPAALEWIAHNKADKHGLQVSVEADPQAITDDERLRVFVFQAVREMLFNVVKHAKTEHAELRLIRHGDELVLTVSDNGAGFDPASLASSSGPSGLGLVSIRERADLLGADFQITSAPGCGTTMTLRWPAQIAATAVMDTAQMDPAPAAQGVSARRDGRLRILVADDHETIRDALCHLLDCEDDLEVVAQVCNGAEAVAEARRLHPDVVIMDVAMPGVNGLEATARIARLYPAPRVIGLSMFEDSGLAQRMRSAGAETMLSKSGPSAELLMAIRGEAPAE